MVSMTCSTWTAAILLALASHAHGFAALQQLRPTPCHQAAAAATPLSARPAVAAVRLQAAEGGEPEPAAAEADVEVVQDAAETPEAAENPPADAEGAASAEEEEEEEDLLSTPAFLKQKLKVLEKELEEVLAKTEECAARRPRHVLRVGVCMRSRPPLRSRPPAVPAQGARRRCGGLRGVGGQA
jgi:hypothetical protein